MLRLFARFFVHKPSQVLPEWHKMDQLLLRKEITADKAMKAYQDMILSKPNNMHLLGKCAWIMYNEKQWSQLPNIYSAIQKADPKSQLPLIFQKLHQLELSKKESIKEIESKLSIDRMKPIDCRYLSILYSKYDKKWNALKTINRYFKEKENCSDIIALHEKLQLEIACEVYESALETCNKLLALDSFALDILHAKARVLASLGRKEHAMQALNQLLTNHELSKKRMALIYKDRADLRDEKAIEEKISDLKMAFSLYPELACHKDILILFHKHNMLKEAEAFIKEIPGQPNDYIYNVVKADILLVLKKDYKAAKKQYEKVLELSPSDHKNQYKLLIEDINKMI